MNFFVNKDDVVKIDVFVYLKDNDIEVVEELSEVPKEHKHEKVNFTFRKPTYQDSSQILGISQKIVNNEIQIDPVLLSDQVIKKLLIDWDLKTEAGEKIDCKMENVNKVHPSLIRTAVNKIVKIIKI